MNCPACQHELPEASVFCGFCGYKMAPISSSEHRSLSQEISSVELEEVKEEERVPPPPPTPPSVEEAGETDEQRRGRRFPIKVEVNYVSEHNFYTGFLENLSSGGLFVATHEPASIGERIELNFSVPGLQAGCTAMCEVRWTRDYNALSPDTIPGMGLRFVDLDGPARAAVELFIRHREPIFFDDE